MRYYERRRNDIEKHILRASSYLGSHDVAQARTGATSISRD